MSLNFDLGRADDGFACVPDPGLFRRSCRQVSLPISHYRCHSALHYPSVRDSSRKPRRDRPLTLRTALCGTIDDSLYSQQFSCSRCSHSLSRCRRCKTVRIWFSQRQQELHLIYFLVELRPSQTDWVSTLLSSTKSGRRPTKSHV